MKLLNTIFKIICFLCSIPAFSQNGIISVGKGSYTTVLPSGAKIPSDKNGNPAVPAISDKFTGPIPSNEWWSSVIWKRFPDNPYSENMYPHPFAVKAKSEGLGISYPREYKISADGNTYEYNYKEDFCVGIESLSALKTYVEKYSDWTVTLKWTSGNRVLYATIGHGLPFIYFTCNNIPVTVSFKKNYNIWYNQSGTVGFTVNGHHYAIFAPTGSQWIKDNGLTSSLNNKKYFSVALLPDSTYNTLDFFKKHAFVFVNSSKVSWNYDENTCILKTMYSLQTEAMEGIESKPLTALYPHQWKHILSQSVNIRYSYQSSRGIMKLIKASGFETQMKFKGVIPSLPDLGTYNKDRLKQYIQNVSKNDSLLSVEKDTYWTGKELGKVSALVRIADQMGDNTSKNRFLFLLKEKLQDWLSTHLGEKKNLFYYDKTWHTLIGYPASYGLDTELNDHNFHYGYFLTAAATIAQFDLNWSKDENWGGMINLLIKDIANSEASIDNRFPKLRSFDPYAGHCWASGHSAFRAGNNQESSSESINFSSALILWGAVTGNIKLRDLGIFLYTTETAAVREYWFDVSSSNFPSEFTHTTLGILWSNGGAYGTWWASNPEEIHGINWLPFNGGSFYLAHIPEYINKNYSELISNNKGIEQEWKDLVWQFQAFSTPEESVKKFEKNKNYTPEKGTSKAFTYHWIHNLNTMGYVDTTVHCNVPTYACFLNETTRTYIAFNPTMKPLTVTFSDNYKIALKEMELKADTVLITANNQKQNTTIPH